MPRYKSTRGVRALTAHYLGKRPQGVLDEPESLAALLETVRKIPPHPPHGGADGAIVEHRAKRAKASEDRVVICIAREQLILPVREVVGNSESTVITRQNCGEVLAFRSQIVHEAQGPRWCLSLAPRGKSRGPDFLVTYDFEKGDLSDRQEAALRVASTQGFDPGDQGCLWASIDVCIQQDGDMVELELSIEVRWNQSLTIWGASQSSPQQALRDQVLATWYPEHWLPRLASPSATPHDFYEAVFIPDREAYGAQVSSLEVAGLQASLYPFQQRAVQWLLQREGVCWHHHVERDQGAVRPFSQPDSELPITFVKVKDCDGGVFFVSPTFGVATTDVSAFQSLERLRGGILAEEMGLGKTLEVIALILLHPRPQSPAMVFDSFLGRDLLATPATLIVTPSSLLEQWLSELGRHAPHLKVLSYPGLKKAAKNKHGVEMSARYLDEHDVVVTTYDVLRNELWLASDEPQRSMRNSKQYKRPTSPLVQLSWWRVCIDEAQMVENWMNNAAKLARRLPRINAWAITGTPVKDDIRKGTLGAFLFSRGIGL